MNVDDARTQTEAHQTMPSSPPRQVARPDQLAARDYIRLLRSIATLLNNDMRCDTAAPVYETAFSAAMRLYGLDHELTHDCLNGVALCHHNRGANEFALKHYELLSQSTLRVYGASDELHLITIDNVEHSRTLVEGTRPTNVAEIVLRSFFPNEYTYARFKIDHAVEVLRAEHLGSEGSLVVARRPDQRYPVSVEHAPGGVVDGDPQNPWTLSIRWMEDHGGSRIYFRLRDGTSETRCTGVGHRISS